MATKGLTPIKMRPLTGLLDMISSPEEMPSAALRFKSNFQVQNQTILKRRAGWRKLFSGRFASDTGDSCFCPSNFDLHDQLLPLQTYQDELEGGGCSPTVHTRDHGREHVTTLFEAETQQGNRKLFAGTQSRIYSLNESSGNWRLIADGWGGPTQSGVPSRRWQHAQLGDTILFTNDYDKILYHEIGQPIVGCEQQAVAEVEEMDDISVESAKIILEYNGVILIMNIVEAGVRQSSRIRWCGLNQPLRWNSPDPETVAGFLDLDYTETILGAAALRGVVFIYTDKSIWRFSTSGTSSVFAATKVYTEPVNLDGCLAFRNSLVSTGDTHYYMARDGIYKWDLFKSRPERVEWIHRSASLLYDHETLKVDPECCEQVVAGYWPKEKEIWISWPAEGASCLPSKTLVLDTKYKSADYIDHGFTVFANYRSDNSMSLADWLVEYCVCSVEDTLEFYEKEGLPSSLCNVTCGQLFTPQSLYTSDAIAHDAAIVDYTKPSPDNDSLCQLLGDKRIEDFCHTCDSEQVFIGVSATDKCLKEIGHNFSRENCINSETGFGESGDNGYCCFEAAYEFNGYNSILRGTLQLGSDDFEKMIKQLIVSATVTAEPNPPSLRLRIGASNLPLDPNPANPFTISGNGGDCDVVWYLQRYLTFECPAAKSASELVSEKLRNVREFVWPLHRRGKFIHFELSVVGYDGTDESLAVGGDGDFTSLTVKTRLQQV